MKGNDNMKIILEGADGTGKTTLAKILANRYGLDICHCTQDDPSDYIFYRETLRKNNVVWDRHTLGELVYPQIFDRRQEISPEDARLILHSARNEGVKVFVLTADPKIMLERIDARGDEDQRIHDNLVEIDRKFKLYAKEFRIPIIDTSTMTLQEIFNLVEEKEIA